MTTTLTAGMDRVFGIPTAFSAGFMKDPPDAERRIFGPSPLAFGHPGAGGSHAFADPENNLAFAYVMNQMEQQILPNEKSLRLVDALYRSDSGLLRQASLKRRRKWLFYLVPTACLEGFEPPTF